MIRDQGPHSEQSSGRPGSITIGPWLLAHRLGAVCRVLLREPVPTSIPVNGRPLPVPHLRRFTVVSLWPPAGYCCFPWRQHEMGLLVGIPPCVHGKTIRA